MLKKYSTLIGFFISLSFLLVAMLVYPGGSQHDKNSVGYSWPHNYLSNLFGAKAINGMDSPSRYWAGPGMFFLSVSFALFFINVSAKIPEKKAAWVVRYFGAGAMLFAFLAITPYHDIMVTIAGTMALVSMFYITVFVFRSALNAFFKILSVACLVIFYSCNFVYYTSTFLQVLPVLQKTELTLVITWAIALQYFTSADDLRPREKFAKVR